MNFCATMLCKLEVPGQQPPVAAVKALEEIADAIMAAAVTNITEVGACPVVG